MFDWLFRRARKPKTDQPPNTTVESNTGGTADFNEVLSKVVWVEPEDNAFGMRVLDCRPFATTIISVTFFKVIAKRFTQSRQSNGEKYRGQFPSNVLSFETHLTFPHDGKTPGNGAVFLAQVMEDKWDIFLHNGYLYFTHSWTGILHFRAQVGFEEGEITIAGIDANSDVVDGDSEMAIKLVDFLVKSYIYSFVCPHPVPDSMRDEDDQKIVLWSFGLFGRRGCFATFDDTTKVRVPHKSGD